MPRSSFRCTGTLQEIKRASLSALLRGDPCSVGCIMTDDYEINAEGVL